MCAVCRHAPPQMSRQHTPLANHPRSHAPAGSPRARDDPRELAGTGRRAGIRTILFCCHQAGTHSLRPKLSLCVTHNLCSRQMRRGLSEFSLLHWTKKTVPCTECASSLLWRSPPSRNQICRILEGFPHYLRARSASSPFLT